MQTSKHKGVAREAQRYELTGVPTSTWYDYVNGVPLETEKRQAEANEGVDDDPDCDAQAGEA